MQKLKKIDRREDVSEKKKADLPIFLQKSGETFVCRIVPCTLQQSCASHSHLPKEVFRETSMQEGSVWVQTPFFINRKKWKRFN